MDIFMTDPGPLADIALGLQIASALAGLMAAWFWWKSAILRAPPTILDGGKNLQDFLNTVSSRNQWAAIATAISIALASGGTVLASL